MKKTIQLIYLSGVTVKLLKFVKIDIYQKNLESFSIKLVKPAQHVSNLKYVNMIVRVPRKGSVQNLIRNLFFLD